MSYPYNAAASAWVVDVLRSLYGHPGMWLGAEDVRALDNYLAGCERGRRDCGRDEDSSILFELRRWMVSEGHVPPELDKTSMGWVGFVEKLDPSPKNIYTFFRLFDEFLVSLGQEPLQPPRSHDGLTRKSE